jgi:fibrillarin-like rRNA methylase
MAKMGREGLVSDWSSVERAEEIKRRMMNAMENINRLFDLLIDAKMPNAARKLMQERDRLGELLRSIWESYPRDLGG